VFIYDVLDFDGGVMAVEGVDELWEEGDVVGPNADYIIKESTVKGW